VTRLKKFTAKNVDLTALVAAVRKLAADRPDFTYSRPSANSCLYRPTKQAGGGMSGCIIGEGLRACGISTTGLDTESDADIGSHLARVNKSHTHEARWLAEVQSNQDFGRSWGEAVVAADKEWPL
jgi:hypothetical protein